MYNLCRHNIIINEQKDTEDYDIEDYDEPYTDTDKQLDKVLH